MKVHPVIVVGGGPAGLSAAYELVRAGFQPLVLEQSATVGDVWRNHYEGVRLNTGRWFSNLPGCRFPWSAGRWPTGYDLADQLAGMPQRGKFAVQTGVEVAVIEPAPRKDQWRVVLANGDHLLATAVVLATGCSRLPHIPQWPGRERFGGQVLHAAQFGRAQDYSGQHVLVVGSGNSSCEIASRLLSYAASVTLSVRHSPHFLPKSLWGLPIAAVGELARRLPVTKRDRILAGLSRLWVGDLRPYGLPAPARSVSQLGTVTPTLYMPFVRDLKAGRICIVGPVQGFTKDRVLARANLARESALAELPMQVVIAGTGYRTGLEQLVQLPELLESDGRPNLNADGVSSQVPGLFFIGYINPLSGQLREIGKQAPRLAGAVQRYLGTRDAACGAGIQG